jgi:ABC-type dipeptide/oligopeptide/nickel transport system ATPase component
MEVTYSVVRRRLHVDLTGLSGSGKSTVALRIEELLNREGISCHSRRLTFGEMSYFGKLFWGIRVLRYLTRPALSLFGVQSTMPLTRKANLWMYLVLRWHLATHSHGVLVYDESLLTRLFSLVSRGILNEEEAIKFYAGTMPPYTIIIALYVDPAERTKRLKARDPEYYARSKKGQLSEVEMEERNERFRRRDVRERAFLEDVSSKTGFPILFLDGKARPQANAATAAKFVAAHLQ